MAKFEKHQPHWLQNPPSGFPTALLGKKFIHPQNEVKYWTPMKYFKHFWKVNIRAN